MIPQFAVVGRSNKGKSSIVASLIENDTLGISATPRTTKTCQRFSLKADGEELFTIIDTPGFEEAPAALEWLEETSVSAHQRQQRVKNFIKNFADSESFQFERILLEPIMNGAAILYVADASKPFRSHYESEFEILRWTGLPSMALINQIGSADYTEQWTAALNQYFKKVTVFNAHRSYFQDRLHLLEQLRVIHESVKPSIDRAITILNRQQELKLQNSRAIIAKFTLDGIHLEVKQTINKGKSRQSQREDLLDRYQKELTTLEDKSRSEIKKLFNYKNLESQQRSIQKAIYEQGIFSKETFETLGLSRSKLITAGTAAGALTGGGLDAMVGGASLLVGTGIGALIGGGSSAYLSYSASEIAGIKLQKAMFVVGPNRNPNFPWVLLDRNLMFLQAILQRTHAMQDAMKVMEKPSLTERLPTKLIHKISRIFKKSKRKIPPSNLEEDLANVIDEILVYEKLN